jgi:tRNA dimethylallyltransferase
VEVGPPAAGDVPAVLVITGPTASGKTAVGLRCAALLGAEIISADSRQVYRGLDIGTAKPDLAERQGIPHHFIDRVDIGDVWTAGRFYAEASALIAQLHRRGLRAVVVGGSGLYVRALTRGLFEGAYRDEALRAQLEEEFRTRGPEALLAELRERDPACAARIDAANPRRLLRALEVCRLSGQPFSRLQASEATVPPHRSFLAALAWPREVLYRRIDGRVDDMLRRGLLAEAQALAASGADLRLPALNTVGYAELFRHLAGACSLDEAVRLIKQHTRNFAKRQLTWFRRDPAMHWYPCGADEDAAAAADRMVADFLLFERSGK